MELITNYPLHSLVAILLVIAVALQMLAGASRSNRNFLMLLAASIAAADVALIAMSWSRLATFSSNMWDCALTDAPCNWTGGDVAVRRLMDLALSIPLILVALWYATRASGRLN